MVEGYVFDIICKKGFDESEKRSDKTECFFEFNLDLI